MRISGAALVRYHRAVEGLSDLAASEVRDAVRLFLEANPAADVAQVRGFTIAAVRHAAGRYGDASSAGACRLFDEIMALEGASVPAATVYAGPDEAALEGTVRRLAGRLAGDEPDPEGYLAQACDYARDLVRRAARDTVTENAGRARRARGGARVAYARVPTSGSPCPYCAMLASRGFVYASEGTAAAGSHHNCTCVVVPGVRGRTRVDDYDPDAWERYWREPKGLAANRATDDVSHDERARLSIAADSNFYMQDDPLRERMKVIEPEPGFEDFYDVGIHGDGTTFSNGHMDRWGELADEVEYTVDELAEMIRMDKEYPGGPIRLVSCWSGERPDGAAKQLADLLGQPVRAPDMMVFIDHDGKFRLARNRLENKLIIEGKVPETGKWHTFMPGKQEVAS